jgi:hypothetical protein
MSLRSAVRDCAAVALAGAAAGATNAASASTVRHKDGDRTHDGHHLNLHGLLRKEHVEK